ncbi:MAG: zinc ribbon domain-containing protein [Oscillospiraceae bacterium]|nr:zinc ribbon domain-containing protein [Oscillospiraceae bacterium]
MNTYKYCIFCGAELHAGEKICPACGKKTDRKDELLKDYLYRNTKESLKGKIDDTLFEVIKNWLLSHLYGVVLTLTVIGSVAYGSQVSLPGYVERISSAARPGTVVQNETGNRRFGSEEMNAATQTARSYTHSVFARTVNSINAEIGDWDEDSPPPETFYMPSSLGTGRHEYVFNYRYKHNGDEMQRGPDFNAPTTELGKQLLSEGYDVAEIEEIQWHRDSMEDSAPIIAQERYLFVLVKVDGTWYIAEDVLIG